MWIYSLTEPNLTNRLVKQSEGEKVAIIVILSSK